MGGPPIIKVGNCVSRVENVERHLLYGLDTAMAIPFPGAAYMMRARPGFDGLWHPFDCGTGKFPTGLVGSVRKLLPLAIIEDLRERPQVLPLDRNILGLRLRDYQFQSVKTFFAMDRGVLSGRGVLQLAMAAGKTITFLAIAAHIPGKCVIILHRKDLLHQWREEIQKIMHIEPACIGDGAWDDRIGEPGTKFVIAMPQTIGKSLTEFRSKIQDVKLLGIDECQRMGASSWYAVAQHVPAYFRCGLSGTIPEDPVKAGRLKATTGGILIKAGAVQLAKMGFLSPCTVVLHRITNPGVFGNWHTIRRQLIEDNTGRNNAIVEIVMEEVAKGKRVLVFFDTIRHARIVKNQLVAHEVDVRMVTGKDSSASRNEARSDLKTGRLSVALASLPPRELILVRDKNANETALVEIGKFCEKMYEPNRWLVWTRLRSGNDGWAPITGAHSHPRGDHPIVRTTIAGTSADVLVTDNHSLVDDNFMPFEPAIGKAPAQLRKTPTRPYTFGTYRVLDIVAMLPRDPLITRIELRIPPGQLTQLKVRKLKAIGRLLRGEAEELRTQERWEKWRNEIGIKDDSIVEDAIEKLFEAFSYSKGFFRYRKPWPKNASELDFLSALGLTCRIYAKESRSRFTLPLTLRVTPALARLAGIAAAESCMVDHKGGTKTFYFAALDYSCRKPKYHWRKGKLAGYRQKKRIRHVIETDAFNALGWEPRKTNKGLEFLGTIPLLLARCILDLGGKAPDKRIPDFIWDSSLHTRRAFLFGYFMGDGHFDRPANRIIWTTVSRHLAIGTYYLLKSLGATRVRVDQQPPTGLMRHRRYNVTTYDPIFFSQSNLFRQKTTNTLIPRVIKGIHPAPEHDDATVYDLSVADVECFYAGFGILCHNTQTWIEGVDLPALDTVVLAAGGKSSAYLLQRLGRALRKAPGKTEATIHDFHDTGNKYVLNHSMRRQQIIQHEKFAMKTGKTFRGEPGQPPQSVVDDVEVHEPGVIEEEEA